MESRGIHHVGVAVPDLDEPVATYVSTFGGTLEHREVVTEQGVELEVRAVAFAEIMARRAVDERNDVVARKPVHVRHPSMDLPGPD